MEKYLAELSEMIKVAKDASSLVLDIYHKGFTVEIKEDDSPVTDADKNSDKVIRSHLLKCFPDHAFLSEEESDDLSRLNKDLIFIIDPLDGTKDFVNHDDEFAINLALCYKHEIVASVTAIPVYHKIYYALKNRGAYKLDTETNVCERIFVNDKKNDLIVFKSRYHAFENEAEVYARHKDRIKEVKDAGSSYKACLIAEGKGEITYRLNKGTKEWDTASFTLLIEEAGGYVLDLNKKRIPYNRENVHNGSYIVVNSLDNWLYP